MSKVSNVYQALLMQALKADLPKASPPQPPAPVHGASHVGDLKLSACSSDFERWMVCDGRELQREAYPMLFSVIGTSYGSASEDTFCLPDCRGRTVATVGQGPGLSERYAGEVIGRESLSLTVHELPPHNHNGTTNIGGNHTHQTTNGSEARCVTGVTTIAIPVSDGDKTATVVSEVTLAQPALTNNGNHTHTYISNSNGHGHAFSLYQPTIHLGSWFIYTD